MGESSFLSVADQLPYGHGEKSVYLIEHFMRLKTDEPLPSLAYGRF